MVHWSRQQIISSCCRGQHTSKQGNSGQDRPPGGLMTWDHQGLSIGKKEPEAFDNTNFLIHLHLTFKPDLQILFLSPSKNPPRPARRPSNLSGHFIFTWNASTCSLLLYMTPMVPGGAYTLPSQKRLFSPSWTWLTMGEVHSQGLLLCTFLPSLIHRLGLLTYGPKCLTLVSLVMN